MKADPKTLIIDIDSLDEMEYDGYRIVRVEPQYYFYIITATDGPDSIARALRGKWTSPKEAMAAIDAAKKRKEAN